jgi:hypothetical protein
VFALAPIVEFPWFNDRIMNSLGRVLAAVSLTGWHDTLWVGGGTVATASIAALTWMVLVVAGMLTAVFHATPSVTSHDVHMKVWLAVSSMWRFLCTDVSMSRHYAGP